MSISRIEQETIITFNEEEKTAQFYTFNGKMKRKLADMAEKFPKEVQIINTGTLGDVTYSIPKNLISLRQPVSDERREACRQRALELNLRPVRTDKTPCNSNSNSEVV